MSKLILVPSKSRFELDINKHGSEAAASKFYSDRKRWDDIKEGHDTQKRNLDFLMRELSSETFVDRSGLTEERIEEGNVFAFVGGDNHFTYCSQLVLKYLQQHPEEDKKVVGVFLDPSRSSGALLNYKIPEFLAALDNILAGKVTIEQWTTLEAMVDNGTRTVVTPAVGDYFVGEYCSLDMSRNESYIASIEGKMLPEKGSGILAVTGSGSCPGSWYDNVHQCYFNEPDAFPKDEEIARIIVRENKARAKAILRAGEILTVSSYNDGQGIIAPDSHKEHIVNFPMGSTAEIKISDRKLLVVGYDKK
jgi:hypothetical protein